MLAAAYLQYASLDPSLAALHLDRFEQPAEKLKTAHEAYFQYALTHLLWVARPARFALWIGTNR